ncbi:dipeptidyl aminopeptidase/acylaminoacyl peptidase [Leucobacter komagatae]|uniref:Dipeptidyl aminopeptidase/acylaminoacyl peptidase n=1 Tax=Leucobacter komagatae TaxID=55969 RepID=A0A542XYC8_9MICO|nr:serine hydrolase [Leucobacter komagatae]TQL40818.1 dipeptidyl aminopeptidase/acylaminoacyl peptidase [Leucobacter komagatae]
MTQRRVQTDEFLDHPLPEQPTLSPDGSQVVYVLRTTNRGEDRDERSLWLAPTAGGPARRLTRGTADTAPAWSPDGTRIAFLRTQSGPAQLWVLPVAGGEAEQVTKQPLGAGPPVWSADSAKIAFSGPIDLGAAPADGDTPSPTLRTQPIVTDRLFYKADGSGFLGAVRTHLHVVDLAGGTTTRMTTGDWLAGRPVWSPDGSQLAFTSSKTPGSDLDLTSVVYLVPVNRPLASPRALSPLGGQYSVTTWSPDGAEVIAVGRDNTEVGNASLFAIPLDGSPARNLTLPLDRNVMQGAPGYPGALPQYGADGSTLVFCARESGYTNLYVTDPSGFSPRSLVGGAANISGVSVAGSQAAIVLGTETSFGEIAVVDLVSGTVTVLTDYTPEDSGVIVAEPRSFTISDGTTVHGWLRRDPSLSGPLPLLLDVHGGPHNAWNGVAETVHAYHHELVNRGWAVLTLNPRGSDGYGEAFMRGVLGVWGHGDANDFLEPLDALVAEGVADADRLAITGYSYGGFTTCYLTSRDQRFAAAVAGGVVSDLASLAGTSDVGHFISQFENLSLPWQTPEVTAPQSPITKVGDVRTPTLIVHGGEDHRCPVGQAEQWFTALREQGVPTELVLYPGGAHGFLSNGRPSHRADWNRRIVDWVVRHVPEAGKPVRTAALDAAHWQQRLSELATLHGIPGATLGILRLGEDPAFASHGILNVNTGVETTNDSVFQIGSITKVWTATVTMQLIDEGKLSLDTRVVDIIPEFAVADEGQAELITIHHLLTHTNGIDGDNYNDLGRGDDCLEKYVASLAEAPLNHPVGATFSYSNAGYALLGRIIEVVTGKNWDEAMRERLYTPLGLKHTSTLPEDALRQRAAFGHLGRDESGPLLAPRWSLPRSLGPSGIINSSTADVLEFVRMHLEGGVAANGTRVLSAESAKQMTEFQVALPDTTVLGDSWGLGWIRYDWNGTRLFGHDGGTVGQAAILRVLPEAGLAVVMLTNGGAIREVYRELFNEIFEELGGVSLPAAFAPPEVPFETDVSEYVGEYKRASVEMEAFVKDGALRASSRITGIAATFVAQSAAEYDLPPVSDGLFAVGGPGAWTSVKFYTLPNGDKYIHSGGRAVRKVSS